jgi:hypothetical protein
MAKPDMPTPPATRQTSGGPSAGQASINPVSGEIPFRSGPKNWCQFPVFASSATHIVRVESMPSITAAAIPMMSRGFLGIGYSHRLRAGGFEKFQHNCHIVFLHPPRNQSPGSLLTRIKLARSASEEIHSFVPSSHWRFGRVVPRSNSEAGMIRGSLDLQWFRAMAYAGASGNLTPILFLLVA